MNVVAAPDSFKENLTAQQVAFAIERGVKNALPSASVTVVPMSDGGEGSLQSVVDATNGRFTEVDILDALLRPIKARYGVFANGTTAFIESAQAVGLGMLTSDERNPLNTSTYGVGQLIKHAVQSGCKQLIVGLGGSSTNDGGAGMLQALGSQLLDDNGNPIGAGNKALAGLASVDISAAKELLNSVAVTIAGDVTNPLCGSGGATYVFAPQKGAAEGDLAALDKNLERYAAVIGKTLGKSYASKAGAGAAGGLGFALMVAADAAMRKGVELIADLLGLEAVVAKADIVFTGEGSIDGQTAHGKVVSGISAMSQKYGVPVVALCGKKSGSMAALHQQGLTATFSIADSPMTLAESMQNAERLLEEQAEEVMRIFISGTTVAKKL